MVHVVVVGCGRVGSGLARALDGTEHSVAIIDLKSKAFSRLGEDFGGTTIVGVGFDRDRLGEAGIERADALAAVTSGDNSNILVARVARETYGVKRVVARIKDPRRAAIYERLGIPTIASVQWATERVLHHILPGGAQVDWIDPSAKVSLIERLVPAEWAGHPVGRLELAGRARVMAITRLGVAQICDGDRLIQDGDVVHVAVASDHVDTFDSHLNEPPPRPGKQ